MSTLPMLPAVEIAVRTDPGRDPDKQVNEDASIQKETTLGLLAVVCDGMGGHAGGKEASELAIATIVEIIEAAPAATSPGVALKRAIEEANARIWSMPTAEAGYRPGSTVVAVLAHEGGAEVAHVGDSRLYLVHAGAISQVTRDHSMVQELVDRKLIRAEDAAKHPEANKILRALGIAKDVDVELRPAPLSFVTGDVLVLCSDGLSDLVEPAEILQLAGSHPPAQAAGQLVDLANARGGHDNITAMVVRMKSSANLREPLPLMKTMPFTAHGAGDASAGPTGTIVSAPMPPAQPGSAGQPASAAAGYAMPPTASHRFPGDHAPSAVPSHPHPQSARTRTPIVALGVLLAVVAVAIVGAVVVVTTKKPHHSVSVVVDPPREAAAAPELDDDDASPPEVVPAPTLTAEPSAKWHPRDGQAPDPCGALQRARDRDASAGLVGTLEKKCRASLGAP